MAGALKRAGGWIAVAAAFGAAASLVLFRSPATGACGSDAAVAGATLGFLFGMPAAGLLWVLSGRTFGDGPTAQALRWAGIAVGGLALVILLSRIEGLGGACAIAETEDRTVAAVGWLVPILLLLAGLLAYLRTTAVLNGINDPRPADAANDEKRT